MLPPHILRRVTNGHRKLVCTSLSGLTHEVCFHFHPRTDGVFVGIELHRVPRKLRRRFFERWQDHPERTFGPMVCSVSDAEVVPKCQ